MRSRGFTLIELMISMALFGLIAAGAMSLVLSGTRTQTHSARVDVAQTALRTAIDFITRDVMSAAAGVTSGTITLNGGTTTPAVTFDSTVNNIGTNAADILDVYTVDGTTMVQANAIAAGASSLTITGEAAQAGIGSSFTAFASPYQTYVQIFDPSAGSASVVSLTGATATTLTLGQTVPTAFAAYAYVVPSRHVRYTVSTTTFANLATAATANTSMLMLSVNGSAAQPLAEGIEDMQIAYGFDTDGDGIVTESTTPTANNDEWLYNVAGETPTAQMIIGNLMTIRVTLVAKGTAVDGGQQNLPGRPTAEDHAGAANDGFIRRVLRTEIAVRSFNL
jgi:prepilin-type N-terminal cleavage/methylation domain-containing protein